MAAKGWWIGCGSLVIVGVLIVVLAFGYFASRAGDFTRSVESAKNRYVEINREFSFKPPPSGALTPERFSQYLQVRTAVHEGMTPMDSSSGVFEGLFALQDLPENVSRVHVEALRQHSMSVEEYLWISRQIYTTVAAEEQRADADPALKDLRRELERNSRGRGNVRIQSDSGSSNTFENELLDLTWLRVPEATRQLVREHVAEISKTRSAMLADTVLINFGVNGMRQ